MKNRYNADSSKQSDEAQKEILNRCTLEFIRWSIQTGNCPAELQCWVCKEMKGKDQIGSICFLGPIPILLCIRCTDIMRALEDEQTVPTSPYEQKGNGQTDEVGEK